MTKRIEEDRKHFRDIVSGRIRKELQRLKKTGSITRLRGKNGKISVSIPGLDIPHIVHGSTPNGIGRGTGKPGDVIGRKPGKGKGEGGATDDEGNGIIVSIDMEEILQFLQNELQLPDLKPKESNIFEETKIKYTDVALTGPESLRHNRRTMKEAMRRLAGTGELTKLHTLPGFPNPVPLITVINSDKRYRQYKEIKIPSSNALLIFARDWSGSMDDYRCDIVSDMSWWVDCWVRRYYKKVERVYIGHDVVAQEVDENDFYHTRYGGGTKCSSALKRMVEIFDNKYKPEAWNIYVFYYTDGDNWGNDNEEFLQLLQKEFTPEKINMVGIAQVCCWNYDRSLKHHLDDKPAMPNVRTVSIGSEETRGWGSSQQMSEEERNKEILRGIQHWLGGKEKSDEKVA